MTLRFPIHNVQDSHLYSILV
uniref:Uncharacterized protein n=1 Tax=Lepeophtheirus salmonis TaxID=72036 RepID=A0A0K2U4P9_LEPSM